MESLLRCSRMSQWERCRELHAKGMMVKQVVADKGSVLVEATIVLPLLWLLLAAIVQFGYAFSVLITMQNAALAAVRSATLVQGRTTTEVCEVARAAAAATMIEPSALTCSTSPQLPASPDTLVIVALSYPIPLFLQGELSTIGPNWVLEAQAAMY